MPRSRDEYPGAIEGSRVKLSGKNIKPTYGRPIKRKGRVFYPFKLSFASAEIVDELIPKEAWISADSMLDAGDSVKGKQLHGLSIIQMSAGDIKVGGSRVRSGRHSNQELSVSGFRFVEIIEGFRGSTAPGHTKYI